MNHKIEVTRGHQVKNDKRFLRYRWACRDASGRVHAHGGRNVYDPSTGNLSRAEAMYGVTSTARDHVEEYHFLNRPRVDYVPDWFTA